mmetsp:Transcript_47265/g.100888  ORF Transcript_47265/g.100888 Transcript_47265/m.100888 type:complete len:81 (-) Transcript_47265:94-336(-)
MNRRAKEIDSDQSDVGAVELRDGEQGWRHHWRHGMIGAVQFCADGSRPAVVKMQVGLADAFNVKVEVGQQLSLERDTALS